MSFYADRIFPHLLHWVSGHFAREREQLLAEAEGRVLELGVGTGANLEHYPERVTEVVAIDPHEAVLRKAAKRLRRLENGRNRLPYRVRLERVDAQALPYDDASFDTVVAFLVLCTVPEAERAAAEARRVLRPGGRLLVMEHVGAEPESALRRWQRRLDPLWSRAAVGCHLHRDTEDRLADAGFDTAPLERYHDDAWFPPTAPRIRGVLRK